MARSKTTPRSSPKSSLRTTTPGWIDDILKAIDDVSSPVRSVKGPFRPSANASPAAQKMIATANFSITALGFAFAVVNAVYLSTIDQDCSGYNSEEQKFLFAVSIILAAFFGILMFSSIYGLSVVFRS